MGRLARDLERLVDVEHRVMHGVGSIESVLLDDVLPRLGRAADHGMLWTAFAGGLAATGPAGRRAAARGLLALALASGSTNVLMKRAARRSRPPAGLVPSHREPRRTPLTTSFPSGHSASAAAFAVAATLELPWTGVVLLPLAAAVAGSRVVTGVHYPSDVLAGAAIGASVAIAVRAAVGDHGRDPVVHAPGGACRGSTGPAGGAGRGSTGPGS